MSKDHSRGFLVLEVLIAGLILTASIASAMYLFQSGFNHLERVNKVNLLSAKLLQAASLLKIIELEKQSGTEDLGDGVVIQWTAYLLASNEQNTSDDRSSGRLAVKRNFSHNLFLYKVDFILDFQGLTREYHVHIFRSRPLYWR